MIGRDAGDMNIDPDEFASGDSSPRLSFGVVHPLTGPVYIEGAEAGDVLAVTIEKIDPGPVGWTSASEFGFAGAAVESENRFIVWRLNDEYAVSDDLPGIRIPNASFPGVVSTMPGPQQLQEVLEREQQLADAGGAVFSPDPDTAEPSSLCGVEGTKPAECLRTIPPREFGGNMDIRYMQVGVTIYLPCFIDGCGLAIGDLVVTVPANTGDVMIGPFPGSLYDTIDTDPDPDIDPAIFVGLSADAGITLAAVRLPGPSY